MVQKTQCKVQCPKEAALQFAEPKQAGFYGVRRVAAATVKAGTTAATP
jgi:hypothetical protein